LTYILLGVFLGAFGGHNFYAGYIKRAVIQLLLTVLTCFFGAIISWMWAIVEVCVVKQDDDGVAFI
jgi:TM2 domain-containing membrane protein YozV